MSRNRNRGRGRGNWAKGLAVITATVLMTLCAGEVAVRIALGPKLQDDFWRSDPLTNHRHRENFEGVLSAGMPEGYRLPIRIDSQGFIYGHDPAPGPHPGVYRVIVVGDSFTAGLEGDANIGNVLERDLGQRLSADGRRIEVINAGNSTFSSLIHAANFRHYLARFEPDAILLLPDLTDVYDDSVRYLPLTTFDGDGLVDRVAPTAWASTREQALQRFGFYGSRFYLWRLTAKALASAASGAPPAEGDLFFHARDPEGALSAGAQDQLGKAMAAVDGYVRMVSAKGVHLAIMTYPHQPQIQPVDGIVYNREYERRLELYAHDRQLFFRSLFDPIAEHVRAGEKLYFANDMHFNGAGMRLLAKLVSETVLSEPEATLGIGLRRGEAVGGTTTSNSPGSAQ